MLPGNFRDDLELFLCFKFCSAGTDDIESACISVCINELVIKLYIIIVDQSGRAALEAEKNIVLVGSLKCIIKATYNVVSAGCLSAREDNAYNLLLGS